MTFLDHILIFRRHSPKNQPQPTPFINYSLSNSLSFNKKFTEFYKGVVVAYFLVETTSEQDVDCERECESGFLSVAESVITFLIAMVFRV